MKPKNPKIPMPDLEAEYRRMAADKQREQEAHEWIEALIGDGLEDEPEWDEHLDES